MAAKYFMPMPTPSHQPYAVMIDEAIRNLNDIHGSTESDICEYITSHFDGLPSAHDRIFSHYFRKLLVAGEIAESSPGRFLISSKSLTNRLRRQESLAKTKDSSADSNPTFVDVVEALPLSSVAPLETDVVAVGETHGIHELMQAFEDDPAHRDLPYEGQEVVTTLPDGYPSQPSSSVLSQQEEVNTTPSRSFLLASTPSIVVEESDPSKIPPSINDVPTEFPPITIASLPRKRPGRPRKRKPNDISSPQVEKPVISPLPAAIHAIAPLPAAIHAIAPLSAGALTPDSVEIFHGDPSRSKRGRGRPPKRQLNQALLQDGADKPHDTLPESMAGFAPRLEYNSVKEGCGASEDGPSAPKRRGRPPKNAPTNKSCDFSPETKFVPMSDQDEHQLRAALESIATVFASAHGLKPKVCSLERGNDLFSSPRMGGGVEKNQFGRSQTSNHRDRQQNNDCVPSSQIPPVFLLYFERNYGK